MLKDLLNFSSEQIEKVKVKFNQHNGDTNPMEEYIKNPITKPFSIILHKQINHYVDMWIKIVDRIIIIFNSQ